MRKWGRTHFLQHSRDNDYLSRNNARHQWRKDVGRSHLDQGRQARRIRTVRARDSGASAHAHCPNVHHHVRVLYPTHPEADGSYTYAFFMDPWLADASYDFTTLFRQAYTEDETQAYLRIWEDVQAAPQKVHEFAQSSW